MLTQSDLVFIFFVDFAAITLIVTAAAFAAFCTVPKAEVEEACDRAPEYDPIEPARNELQDLRRVAEFNRLDFERRISELEGTLKTAHQRITLLEPKTPVRRKRTK